MKKFLSNLGKCFMGTNLLLHFAAILLTYFIVTFQFDWIYFQATRNLLLQTFLVPAVTLGPLLIVMLVLFLLAIGVLEKKNKLLNIAVALIQAIFFGWLISSAYKAFTGRGHPDFFSATTTIADTNFHLGFMQGGIFWGWPSGHTTVAFAVAITLFFLLEKNWIKWLAILMAFYVGIGVSISIHWFSDFMAGIFIGVAIGRSVGKSFRENKE